MSATVSSSTSDQGTRLLLGMTPPPNRDQERESTAGGRIRTLLDLLITDKMDGVDRATSRWRTLRERLGLKGIGCCGGAATWRFGSPPLVDDDGNNVDENGVVVVDLETQLQVETRQQSPEAAAGTTAALGNPHVLHHRDEPGGGIGSGKTVSWCSGNPADDADAGVADEAAGGERGPQV